MTTPTPRKSLEPFLKDDVEFYDHQITGVRKIAPLPSHILADDMGLGKSLQALTIFCIALKMGRAETCIIVCPVTLRENWADEISTFTRIPFLRLGEEPDPRRRGAFKKSTPQTREGQLNRWMQDEGPRILICNYEQLTSRYHKETFAKFVFDIAIFDEAHYIKTHDSQRTKAALALRTKRSFLLTGTPMLNQVNELWPLLHKVEPRTFPKYWQYVNRYCVMGGYNDRQITGVKNANELRGHLSRMMTRRLKKDVLSREEPDYIKQIVNLSATQQEMYDIATDELLLEYPGSTLPASEIANAMVRFMRLLQICATPFCISPSYPDDSMKLDRTVEIIAEFAARNEKLVVFTGYRGVLEALRIRLEKSNLPPMFQIHGDIKQPERVPIVKSWGRVTGAAVLGCMYQVAGEGLNMVEASTVLRTDRLFVPGKNRQAVDRVDRIGQTQPVQVIDIIARGTVEQRVLSIIRGKDKINQDIVENSTGMAKLLEKLRQHLEEESVNVPS